MLNKSCIALLISTALTSFTAYSQVTSQPKNLNSIAGIKDPNSKEYKEALDLSKAAAKRVDSMDTSAEGKAARALAEGALNADRSVSTSIRKEAPAQVAPLYGAIKQDQAKNYSPYFAGSLYVFVSLSMPEGLLESYLRDAHKAGAFVVIKGARKNQSLADFFKTDLLKYVVDGQSGFVIEPRLFDRYGITSVPAIVYSKENFDFQCDQKTQFSYRKKDYDYVSCAVAPENMYWKVGGAVSLWYALEKFEEYGATVAPYKQNFAKNLGGFPSEITKQQSVAETPSTDPKAQVKSFLEAATRAQRGLKKQGVDLDKQYTQQQSRKKPQR